jgi:hypothetical protein
MIDSKQIAKGLTHNRSWTRFAKKRSRSFDKMNGKTIS